MECDTFSDLASVACNPLAVDQIVLTPLRSFVGCVFTGLSSAAYGLGDIDWGREIQMSSNETLQLRIYPKGLLSAGKLMQQKTGTVMVAVRRRCEVGKDHVVLGILWHSQNDSMSKLSPFDAMKTSTDCVATRNLHIFLPSIFNHHDSMYSNRNKILPEWPILDTQNFHAVRPGSYSVHSLIKLENGDVLRRVTAAPGISQYVIAGQLAGVEIQDEMHPSVDQINQTKWVKLIDECSAEIEKKVGIEEGLRCMHNSLHITDCLTAEGLLAIMSHNFSGGAMPDMMHVPGGFPLLIAFMVRLACYPKRFRLSEGHDVDRLANKEVITLFESGWEPVHPKKAGGRNVYAIDIAIRQAYTEARGAAKKLQNTEAPVEDNLIFWHRAGQRCVSAVFGAGVDEFVHPRTTFGLPEKLTDPLVEARNAVIRQRVNAIMAVTGVDAVISEIATVQERRNCLLQVLNSVEHWLRTGTYCGLQIHAKKTTPPRFNLRIQRAGGGKNMLTRDVLRQALDKGVEDSVKQAVANGEANTLEEARKAAQVMRDGIEDALQFDADGRVDFNDISLQMPREALKCMGFETADDSGQAAGSSTDSNNDSDTHEIHERDFEDVICQDAMRHATSMVSASMCSGSMVQLDLEVGCFLATPHATLTCADCETTVHLLTAAFLATNTSQCSRCSRPRCLVCSTAVHKRRKAPFGCLRCKSGPEGSSAKAEMTLS